MTSLDPTQPALDTSALDELRECDGGANTLVAELIDIYLADTPSRLAAVRTAFDVGDATAMGREAHALKSSCAQLGARFMSDCCRQLETLGRAGSLAGAGELLSMLDADFPRVMAELSIERAR